MEPAQLHPLLIPHVVEKIFEHKSLTLKDFLNFRAVCQEWRIQATEVYVSRARLVLSGDQDGYGCSSRSLIAMYTATDFLRDPHNTLFPLPRKLSIYSSFFHAEPASLFSNTLERAFESFIQLVHPELDELKLILNTPKESKPNITSFVNLTSCTALTNFELIVAEGGVDYTGILYRLAWKVLRNSPNLKNVKIDYYSLRHQSRVFHRLHRIPPTVENLQISFSLKTSRHILPRRFGDLRLPNMKFLNLGLESKSRLRPRTFCRLFQLYRNTLTQLSISITSGAMIGIDFPKFPHLTRLSLNIQVRTLPDHVGYIHNPITFSKTFPQVSELMLRETDDLYALAAIFPLGFHAPLVKTCTLPCIIRTPEMMLNFALGFSNLKNLSVSLFRVPHTLPVIFANLATLEELVLHLKASAKRVCLDSAITGIPKLECKNIRALRSYESVDLAQVKTCAGITDLEQLKILEIKYLEYVPFSLKRYLISDVTGYLGLLKMPKLEKLGTEKFQFTPGCAQGLVDRFGKSSVSACYLWPSTALPLFQYKNNLDGTEDADSDLDFELPTSNPIARPESLDLDVYSANSFHSDPGMEH